MTNFRPVQVDEYIQVGTKVYSAEKFVKKDYEEVPNIRSTLEWAKNAIGDSLHILPLILQTVLTKANLESTSTKTGSVLVFCESKFM